MSDFHAVFEMTMPIRWGDMVGVVGSSPIEPTNENEIPASPGFRKLQ